MQKLTRGCFSLLCALLIGVVGCEAAGIGGKSYKGLSYSEALRQIQEKKTDTITMSLEAGKGVHVSHPMSGWIYEVFETAGLITIENRRVVQGRAELGDVALTSAGEASLDKRNPFTSDGKYRLIICEISPNEITNMLDVPFFDGAVEVRYYNRVEYSALGMALTRANIHTIDMTVCGNAIDEKSAGFIKSANGWVMEN